MDFESLREWIKDAHHAEKLASSSEFGEIKSFAEKIGMNRRLLDRNVILDWFGAWQILAENQDNFTCLNFALFKAKN